MACGIAHPVTETPLQRAPETEKLQQISLGPQSLIRLWTRQQTTFRISPQRSRSSPPLLNPSPHTTFISPRSSHSSPPLLNPLPEPESSAYDPPVQPTIDESAIEGPTPQPVVVENQPLTFQIVEGTTERGKRKLIDSWGFSYTVKRQRLTATDWQCIVQPQVSYN